MEAYFDNKNNVLNARIRISRDDSVVYSISTTFGLRGRKITVLRDDNPTIGGPAIVGIFHWKEGAFEIHGQKKMIKDMRRIEGGFLKKTHHWKWSSKRKEYQLKYEDGLWKATLDNNMLIAARFSVPARPHLFTKPEPSLLHLTKTALEKDEVFVIMAFIYSEVKRQDKTNSSSVNGGIGW
ncbi:hypothetical protein BDZ94DRAFT_532250 [Collybia nuda]|uniref:DUF6593 domain-containing protein n=1 Tax=Collybia nuda TaxID=64659 RepID=A0A9P6CKM3_9AGAR|nr:hypothetical protein BDZ94DRAFT_532250 [Collybia nuda]